VDAATAAAYTGCGLFLGPVFPLAVVWSGRVTRTSQRVTSFVISGDLLGGAVLSALLGQLVTSVGVQALPMAFAGLAAGSFCTLLSIQFLGRRLIAMTAA
jgi:fucose permease